MAGSPLAWRIEKVMTEREQEYEKLSDREIVKLALEGKPLAYSALIERYRNGVISHIIEFAGGGDADNESAEQPGDICQETFRKAFGRLKDYNPLYEFSTWLYTIARNTAIDYSRKRKMAMAAGIATDNRSEEQVCDIAGHISPEEKMISSQEYSLLIEHIENLPKGYREIAIMRFIKEYEYQEIALKLNIPVNSVKTKLRRARLLLSKLIER